MKVKWYFLAIALLVICISLVIAPFGDAKPPVVPGMDLIEAGKINGFFVSRMCVDGCEYVVVQARGANGISIIQSRKADGSFKTCQ